jgi:hypothetical protein
MGIVLIGLALKPLCARHLCSEVPVLLPAGPGGQTPTVTSEGLVGVVAATATVMGIVSIGLALKHVGA